MSKLTEAKQWAKEEEIHTPICVLRYVKLMEEENERLTNQLKKINPYSLKMSDGLEKMLEWAREECDTPHNVFKDYEDFFDELITKIQEIIEP